eukprot:4704372-Prymnesium_polylepis.1
MRGATQTSEKSAAVREVFNPGRASSSARVSTDGRHCCDASTATRHYMKRARSDPAEEQLAQELCNHVNQSAALLGTALRLSQKSGDDAAVAAARQERLKKSAGVVRAARLKPGHSSD